jgi:hypothetical protein
VGSGGSFGGPPLTQHIGLGKSAHIVDLEISWPASHSQQHFTGVATDQFLEIKEFAKDYTKLERHAFQLGGANARAKKAPTTNASGTGVQPSQ